MGTKSMRLTGLLTLCASLAGCGSDCDEKGRFDGAWVVSSWVQGINWQVSGFDLASADEATAQQAAVDQAALLSQIFVNGDTVWEVARQGDSDTYTLAIDDQAFDARMVEQKDACNSLDMSFQGAWTGVDGSVHTFKFVGEMTFLGDSFNGTWKYSDSFTWDETSTTGAVVLPTGLMTGERSGRDTGD